MSKHHFTLTPRDLMFMRDARPMEASDAGLGANWPRPDQLWNAIINMFHRQWPQIQTWEGEEHTKNSHDRNQDSSCRFGALQIVGPFPVKQDDNGKTTVYFPCPLDLSADDDGNCQPMKLTSADGTDMPKPLKYAFQAPVLGKQKPPQWLSAEDYCLYLDDKPIDKPNKEKLYTTERNIGIEINPDTGTTKEHQLYQAEYLRLEDDVSMAFSASCDIRAKNRMPDERDVDVWERLNLPIDMIIGGQQGIAKLEILKDGLNLPHAEPQPDSLKVRWTLLSPLVSIVKEKPQDKDKYWIHWLPSWIDAETGKVMLKPLENKPERRQGESREEWRKRCQESSPDINARLIAARIDKPIAFSGWDLQLGKTASEELDKKDTPRGVPKKTLLAVPAGSCYVFECDSAEDVKNLWKALDGKRLSSVYGEKGFGIGVCSSFN